MTDFLKNASRVHAFEQIDAILNFPPFPVCIRVWNGLVRREDALRAWQRHVFAPVVGADEQSVVAVDERLPEKCVAISTPNKRGT